jgi:cell division protein FtsZ
LNITYGDKEVMMDEITSITDFIQDAAGATADVIWGHGYDASLRENISITLIATGFSSVPYTGFESLPERKLMTLGDDLKKEITNTMSSPIDSSINGVAELESMCDVLAKEPFLKGSDSLTETESPIYSNTVESETPIFGSTDLVEEVISNDVTESTTISFDLFDSEIYADDDYAADSLSNEVSETSFDFSDSDNLNAVDSPLIFESSKEVEASTPAITTESASPEIVRHILEDDGETSWNTTKAQAILSPEEQQRKMDERNSKIHSYTNKLKNAEGIADFEKEPAFVRRNININGEVPSAQNNISRFGLSDEDNGSGLRNNNFLHDNVD